MRSSNLPSLERIRRCYHYSSATISGVRGCYHHSFAVGKSRAGVSAPADLILCPHAGRRALYEILAEDPRPAYHDDPSKDYGLSFGGLNVRFRVCDGVLTILDI